MIYTFISILINVATSTSFLAYSPNTLMCNDYKFTTSYELFKLEVLRKLLSPYISMQEECYRADQIAGFPALMINAQERGL